MPQGIYKRKAENKWAMKYDNCIVCGGIDIKHNAKGMCKKCHYAYWRKENIEKLREYDRKRIKENAVKRREWTRKWGENNPEKVRANKRKWKKENPEKVAESKRIDSLNRRHNNPHFRLRCNVSRLINHRLRRRLSSKKGKSTWNFLPYSVDDLMQHLENQFKPKMSWSNYGKWHIDHIIPDVYFNYKFVEDVEFQRCWSLDNLQPLWAMENLIKSDKLNYGK